MAYKLKKINEKEIEWKKLKKKLLIQNDNFKNVVHLI